MEYYDPIFGRRRVRTEGNKAAREGIWSSYSVWVKKGNGKLRKGLGCLTFSAWLRGEEKR